MENDRGELKMGIEVIPIHHSPSPICEEQVMILGFFDGVHIGHQSVIKRGVELARQQNRIASVFTFNHHPSIVFKKQPRFQYLSAIPYKWKYLESLGVQRVYVVDFTSYFAQLTPQDFVNQYLIALGTRQVVAGFDYTYGASRTATIQNLPLYAEDAFKVEIVGEQQSKGKKISSTRLRQLIRDGEVSTANKELGRPYETHGIVIHGDARGRTLGYPTANIEPRCDELIVADGVYAVELNVQGDWYQGMASVGYNITFGGTTTLRIEINLFDFNQEIYGEEVTVRWYQRLRSEEKFSNVTQLIQRLAQDEQEVRRYFKEDKS